MRSKAEGMLLHLPRRPLLPQWFFLARGFILSMFNKAETPAPKAERTQEPMWAMTGKQCWRCGMLREWTYSSRMLAHTQNPQRMLLALDSRTVAMKVGIR